MHSDTWVSMGQEADKAARKQAFEGFTVDGELMAVAGPDAVFMHCLPAYRGLEVTSDVIDGPRSVVFQQGHNRLHAVPGPAGLPASAPRSRRDSGRRMSVKQQRQQAIARLIGQHPVANQPQLLELLATERISATQATVSRDLEELGAIKVRVPGGQSVYALPELETDRLAPFDQLRRVLGEWVGEVASSDNIVVLRTPPGCAHVVASALDRSALDGLHRHRRRRRHGAVRGRARRDRRRRWPTASASCRDWPATMSEPDVPPTASGSTLWHGRFAGGPADALMAYTVSLPFDRRLWRDDIHGSRAHVGGLGRAGLLDVDELDAVLGALDVVEDEMAAGTFAFAQSDEDIHTAVERRVTELAGSAGAKLHTARSRNDQVATDLRLWCKRELIAVARLVVDLQDVLLARAEQAGDTYLPGYTHVQRAQPVLLAHHLMAHGWALARDVDRLVATVERLDVSPLGAGALAGTSLPIDPGGDGRGTRLRRRVRQLARRRQRP